MSFTFTEDLAVNRDFVRFHTGDVVEAESFLSDALITSLLATYASKQEAVIGALRYIIMRFSQPNFRADWLQVDFKSAREGYERLLVEKQGEFGINPITATAIHTYRADSNQTEPPDYSAGTLGSDEDATIIVVINP